MMESGWASEGKENSPSITSIENEMSDLWHFKGIFVWHFKPIVHFHDSFSIQYYESGFFIYSLYAHLCGIPDNTYEIGFESLRTVLHIAWGFPLIRMETKDSPFQRHVPITFGLIHSLSPLFCESLNIWNVQHRFIIGSIMIS